MLQVVIQCSLKVVPLHDMTPLPEANDKPPHSAMVQVGGVPLFSEASCERANYNASRHTYVQRPLVWHVLTSEPPLSNP